MQELGRGAAPSAFDDPVKLPNDRTLRTPNLETLLLPCETSGGIQITRHKKDGFSVRVTLYGKAQRLLADRAMSAVEREMRRCFQIE